MSLADGEMRNPTLYLTSDIALAAYLLMRGFDLLGAIDNGAQRREFGITHQDPRILEDMEKIIISLADEYENLYLPVPNDPGARVNFKLYNRRRRELFSALDEPVRL